MHKDADEHLVEGAIAEAKHLEKQLFPPKVPTCDTCGKFGSKAFVVRYTDR